ncbi:MAG: carbamoyl phosphate synthase large subunit, partial [Deltaproteobacteria bacterium]|nr:carbamoyl phosphate synthase large subunit [Deltaproteobacteria bacterium]
PAVFVKAPVFPFRRFAGVDPVLGPEMKSTGEVMGVGRNLGEAFAKAWLGAGHQLPLTGTAFVSVIDRDKEATARIAADLADLGFSLVATAGTAAFLRGRDLEVGDVLKIHEGRPHVGDQMINREIDLVINTPMGQLSHEDDSYIRETALKFDIPCITTLAGARAAVEAIRTLRERELEVRALGDLDSAGA